MKYKIINRITSELPELSERLSVRVRSGHCTCDDLSEFRVQINGARQEGSDVFSCQDRCTRGQEDFKATNVSVNLKQRLHVFSSRDVLGHSAGDNVSRSHDPLMDHMQQFHLS